MSSMIDSHCHLYYEPYADNLKQTIDECKRYNVRKLLTIGVDVETSKKNIEIANLYNEIYCTIGIHPNSTATANEQDIYELEKLYKNTKKILAIGETGLDYFRDHDKEKQFYYFDQQILLAEKLKLPVIVHTREAEEDTLRFIEKYYNKKITFVIHCFSGSKEFALKCEKLGCYISFSGNITFKNATSLRKVCELVDLSRILIETDSHIYRLIHLEEKNHPSNVRFVCKEIAQIKNEEMSKISKETTTNFNKIFFNE